MDHLFNRYYFKCNCEPCKKNWPMNDDIPKSFNDLFPGQLKIKEAELMKEISKIQKMGSCINLGTNHKLRNVKNIRGYP